MKIPEINCENIKCYECAFKWRNAQLNPDCFLREILEFTRKLIIRNKLKHDCKTIKQVDEL